MTKEDQSSWLDGLKQKRDYLRKWLDQFRSASRAAAEVQKNLDYTDVQIRAIENRPYASTEIPLPNLAGTVTHDLAYLKTAYPWLPEFKEEGFSTASAFSSTSIVQISTYVGRVGDIESDVTREYSENFLDEISQLQARYGRPNEVTALLERIGSKGSVVRLNNALQSYESFRTGTGTRSAAAADMRTLLDGVKGDLYKLARHHPNENMTWETMASRLAVGGPSGLQYVELLHIDKARSSLVSRLSEILKDREEGSLTNLDQVWLELQAHLVAVLGLIQKPTKS